MEFKFTEHAKQVINSVSNDILEECHNRHIEIEEIENGVRARIVIAQWQIIYPYIVDTLEHCERTHNAIILDESYYNELISLKEMIEENVKEEQANEEDI